MKKRVIVVAVHPDDETFGAGGTLLKHINNGDYVYWIIVTSEIPQYGYSEQISQIRQKQIAQVANLYGFNDVIKFDLPDRKLDTIPMLDLIRMFTETFQRIRPNILYLPFKGDVHSDHRKVFEAAFSCTKNFRFPYIEQILMMETVSETGFAPSTVENIFVPNYFIDISDFIDKKIEILKTYFNEIGEPPFPRSIENIKALASYRGSLIGSMYAESFMLLKQIVK